MHTASRDLLASEAVSRQHIPTTCLHTFAPPSQPAQVASIHDSSTHPSYRRTLTLSNKHSCPLGFRLASSGPFSIVEAVPSVTQDPDLHRWGESAEAGGG
jgi:hypothetical protein